MAPVNRCALCPDRANGRGLLAPRYVITEPGVGYRFVTGR